MKNELRLCNWLMVDGELKQVHSLYDWCDEGESGINGLVSMYDSMDVKYPKVKAIPLTEEWLLRFGFNKPECLESADIRLDRQVGSRYRNDLGEKDYFYVISSEVDEYSCYYYVTKEVKWVHQLQNLYYCLTGEELVLRDGPSAE